MEKPKFKPFDRCAEAMSENLDKLNSIRSLHYAYDMENLLSDFMGEIDRQEGEITSQIAHGEFFLKEFKKKQWDTNAMFDRVCFMYMSTIDGLKKEAHQLRGENRSKRMSFFK